MTPPRTSGKPATRRTDPPSAAVPVTKPVVPRPAVELPESTGPRIRSKLSDLVAHEIVTWVADGRIQPGDRLPAEAALVDHFQVSRAVMREALRYLEIAGVVILTAGRPGGAVISHSGVGAFGLSSTLYLELAGATYRDLLEARMVMEPPMARRAARGRTDESLAELRAAVDDLERAGAVPDRSAVAESVTRFHVNLSLASENRALALFVGAMSVAMIDRLSLVVQRKTVQSQARVTTKALRGIIEAVEARDEETAARRVERYLVGFAELLESQNHLLDERVRWRTGNGD